MSLELDTHSGEESLLEQIEAAVCEVSILASVVGNIMLNKTILFAYPHFHLYVVIHKWDHKNSLNDTCTLDH